MKKQTQSGFAVVGVAVVALALLAGAAYTYKNAGTNSDPVGKLAQALSTGNAGVSSAGSGSGTKIPRPCVSCTKLGNEYMQAYIILVSFIDRNNVYGEAMNSCIFSDIFPPTFPYPLDDNHVQYCKKLNAQYVKLKKDVIDAYNRYNNCVQGAKKKRYKVCEHSLIVNFTKPPVDLRIK